MYRKVITADQYRTSNRGSEIKAYEERIPYLAGARVQRDGQVFEAVRPTSEVPGRSPHWRRVAGI